MATRVEIFVGHLGRLNTCVTPAALQRVHRRWLLARPLAWSTNIAWVSWWSGCATALASGVGFTWARYGEEMWTATGLGFAAGTGSFLSGVAISVWILLVLRHSVGELPWRRQLHLILMHALGVFLLILPGQAFTLAVTRGTAGRVASDVFAADAALYDNFELRCLDPATMANPALADRFASGDSLPALRAATQRYVAIDESEACGVHNLRWLRRSIGQDADGASSVLSTFTPEVASRLLEGMRSAGASKELWEHGRGEYFGRYVGCLRLELSLALACGLLISFISYPASGRRRSAWWPSLPRWRLALPRGWLPRFLARAEHRLLLFHPRLWATRFLMFWSLWAMAAVLAAPLIARASSSDRWVVAFFLCGVFFPISWGLVRRPDTLSPDARASRRLVFAGCAALLPGVLAIGAAMALDPGHTSVSISLFCAAALATTCLAISLLRSLRGGISAVAGCVWGTAAWVAAVVFSLTSPPVAWLIFIPLMCAAWLLPRIRSPISPTVERVAGGLLCTVPVSFIALTPLVEGISKYAPAGAGELAALSLLFAGAFWIYAFVTESAIDLLLRSYYQPRAG